MVDQNISPLSVAFLRSLGFEAVSLKDAGIEGVADTDIAKAARLSGRAILTFDKDFGQIYYFAERGTITVFILSLEDQCVESVNKILQKLVSSIDLHLLKNKLIIVYENRLRVIGH